MCVASAKNKKKKWFLIVNTKDIQREREVSKYAKCICDHQKNGEWTLNERMQFFDFTKSVNAYTNL